MFQKFEHRWVFGRGIELNFPSGGAPVSIGTRPFFAAEGTACLSDPLTGQLLFYTDGNNIWDNLNAAAYSSIGGSSNSYQGSIIIPPTPCGNIKNYHVFATWEADSSPGTKDMMHSSYSLSGSILTQMSPPVAMLGVTASERVSAISKNNCEGFWIVTQEINSENVHLVSLDTDTPVYYGMQTLSTSLGGSWEEGQMEFSPDGKYLAWADTSSHAIVVANFNIATGALSVRHVITGMNNPFGLEFSPNSQFLYYSGSYSGSTGIFQHDLSLPTGSHSTSSPFVTSTIPNDYSAMRLGPNGSIYAISAGRNTMSAIHAPDSPTPSTSFVQDEFSLPDLAHHGLPNFPRMLDSCGTGCGCDDIIGEINEKLSVELTKAGHRLKDCAGRRPRKPGCRDLRIPKIKPHIEVHWGQSSCDSIESDDTEKLLITICNPYDNVSFENVILSRNSILDSSGNPVDLIPSGDPSIEATPRGPVCFGTIPACSCLTREIMLRTRGAAAESYQLKFENICFDVNLHIETEACFKIDVCAD